MTNGRSETIRQRSHGPSMCPTRSLTRRASSYINVRFVNFREQLPIEFLVSSCLRYRVIRLSINTGERRGARSRLASLSSRSNETFNQFEFRAEEGIRNSKFSDFRLKFEGLTNFGEIQKTAWTSKKRRGDSTGEIVLSSITFNSSDNLLQVICQVVKMKRGYLSSSFEFHADPQRTFQKYISIAPKSQRGILEITWISSFSTLASIYINNKISLLYPEDRLYVTESCKLLIYRHVQSYLKLQKKIVSSGKIVSQQVHIR